MNKHRILDLKFQRDGTTPYKKVRLRDLWVKRLDENTVKPNYTKKEKEDLIEWSKNFKITTEELEKALSRKWWRTKGHL